MNKLLLVSMLVMLCIANVNAARFLEDTVKTPAQETEAVVPAPVETKPEENTEVVDEKATEQKPQEPTTPVTPVPETENKETPKTEEVEKKETTEVVPPVINDKESEKPKEEAKTQEEAKPEEKKEVEEEKKEQKEEQKEKEEESPIAPISEDDKKNSGYFGLSIGFVLFLALGVLFFFVGFYRYSLRKYKIPPFSPPTFCPNFLFPRPENDLLMEDYCIQSGTEMGGVYSSEKYHNFY